MASSQPSNGITAGAGSSAASAAANAGKQPAVNHRGGKFAVTVMAARNMPESESRNSQLHCVCQFEKQEMSTRSLHYEKEVEWFPIPIFLF